MSVVPVNINGINQLSLNLAGTVTASTAAGITTINQTGVVGLSLEVNGTPNGSQTLLNLQQGTNTTITDNGTGTVTVAVPTATTSTTGAVKPDGTSIVVTGGVISAAASGILFYGDASATCLGGESVVTFGSTPIAGSVSLLLNGVLINTSQYTLTGTVATLVSNTFGVGDIVRAKWSTTNSTPGSITITDTGNTLHSYAASSNTGGIGTAVNVTIPAAASVGDFAVICMASSNGSLPSTPSGCTLVDGTSGSGTFWGGGTYTKTLTSGDISAGYVSFGFTGLWNACMVTFTGSVSVSTFISSRAQSTPVTLTTAGSAVAGNTAIYFGSQGATPGGSTGAVTWNRGTSRSTANDGATNACAVYTETITTGTAGTVTSVVSYASPTAAHNFQTIVVVSTSSTAPGTIPQIDESQVVGLPAFIASAATQSSVQQEAYTYASDTGTANAYAVALTPSPTLVPGSVITFLAAHTNTAASTLAVNGGAAIAIKANGNTTALTAGNITAGQIVSCKYDGTVFQMSVPGSGGGGVTLQTNGTNNGSQTLLNLAAGSGITLVDNGSGTVTLTGGGGGSTPPGESAWTSPTLGSFTALNFGAPTNSGSITGGIYLTDAGTGPTDCVRALVQTITTPASPWTATARIKSSSFYPNYLTLGMVMYDATGGRAIIYGFSNPVGPLGLVFMNNLNSYSGQTNLGASAITTGNAWLRIKFDGTNLNYYYSVDGFFWWFAGAQGVTAFLANKPNQVGIGMNPDNQGGKASAGNPYNETCFSWTLTQP